jgi:hypothetical protein
MAHLTAEELTDIPYEGLFGDTILARVVEEIIADPHSSYRPKDLENLTQASAPRIRDALITLQKLGLVTASEGKHPVYSVNKKSKKFVALTLLAYAALDDRERSDCMDTAIRDYYDTILRSRYEPYAVATAPTYRIVGSGSTAPESLDNRTKGQNRISTSA